MKTTSRVIGSPTDPAPGSNIDDWPDAECLETGPGGWWKFDLPEDEPRWFCSFCGYDEDTCCCPDRIGPDGEPLSTE